VEKYIKKLAILNYMSILKQILEQILKDEESKKFLDEKKVNVSIIHKETEKVSADHYNLNFKIIITEDYENKETAIADSKLTASTTVQPERFSSLREISTYLKSSNHPFLFNVDTYGELLKNQKQLMPLPTQITTDFDRNSNIVGMGLFDFKAYWTVDSDNNFEMVLWPEKNYKMLDSDIKTFLENNYKYRTVMMHYECGLELPTKHLKTKIGFYAKNDPFIVVKSLRDISKIDDRTAHIALQSRSNITEISYWMTEIINSSFYDSMQKFNIDITKKVTPQKKVFLPAEFMIQYLGNEKYKIANKGGSINGLVLAYNKSDEDSGIILIPEKNLEVLKANKDSSKEFLDYFNEIQEVQVKMHGNSVIQVYIPEFIRNLPESRARFYANDWPFVRLQRI